MVARLLVVGLALIGWSQAYFAGWCFAEEPEALCAISGRIVSEDGESRGWVVFGRTSGTIVDVCGRDEDVPPSALRIKYSGFIFPGLIDTHNHSHYSAIPLWRSGMLYNNRYEWRATLEYDAAVKVPWQALGTAGRRNDSLKFGEIRALVGGTTMFQGSGSAYHGYLARNLDLDYWGALSDTLDVTVLTPEDGAYAAQLLAAGWLNRIFLHVGEGKRLDARSLAEFQHLENIGLAVPNVVIIHGVALTQANLATMAQNSMYLVWSPKSNDVLYGETADVVAALGAGVTVSLGPDWSISGSDNLLEELKVAHQYSVKHLGGAITPRQLFKMATTDAAKVAGVDVPTWPLWQRLGKLQAGYQADLFLAPRIHPDPFVSLLKTYSKDIELVVVNGKALCGKRQVLAELVEPAELDIVTVSHKKKAIDLYEPQYGPYGQQRYGELLDVLEGIIGDVAPLVEDDPGARPGYPRRLP